MVSKEIKETITLTIDEVFARMNSISWIDRQKAMKDEAFKNTEKILYCFNILKEHIGDEDEYLSTVGYKKSGSITKYSKVQVKKPDEDQLLKDRIDSYNRSVSDVVRIEKALDKIKKKKGFEVIEYRYLTRKPDGSVHTYEEITDLLAGKEGYSECLNEKTVRNYKNSLVRDMAVFLFGSDAI